MYGPGQLAKWLMLFGKKQKNFDMTCLDRYVATLIVVTRFPKTLHLYTHSIFDFKNS